VTPISVDLLTKVCALLNDVVVRGCSAMLSTLFLGKNSKKQAAYDLKQVVYLQQFTHSRNVNMVIKVPEIALYQAIKRGPL
jgi:hypothetical protein